jgi:hypothetical protein
MFEKSFRHYTCPPAHDSVGNRPKILDFSPLSYRPVALNWGAGGNAEMNWTFQTFSYFNLVSFTS